LFKVCNEQTDYVADMATRGWRLTFRRWPDKNAQNQLRQLRDILTTCRPEKDKPIWIWGKHKRFYVKTMYKWKIIRWLLPFAGCALSS
jgi:hypothetical protein